MSVSNDGLEGNCRFSFFIERWQILGRNDYIFLFVYRIYDIINMIKVVRSYFLNPLPVLTEVCTC